MREKSFEVLGIQPTLDQKKIRSAYLRLARIYHPDRYLDMPPDVRDEAEVRMKHLTAAYEHLRAQPASAKRAASSRGKQTADAWERARQFRAAIEQRRRDDAMREDRWRHWEQLEREARERAALDAEEAARYASTASDLFVVHRREEDEQKPVRRRSQLEIRLEEARTQGTDRLTVRADPSR